ncbi:hypothetical protein B0I35DRAFT_438242 [Stachybotrys elegans]|uniref:Uncharacterized protein n=1 Tax=Stachybotrys elegans TaxID=80388 RepID=A0A8K0SLI4_9HYPO|nr:hypothetical protein B0I35DRAFT_438242 [Stachybotrys elegans]
MPGQTPPWFEQVMRQKYNDPVKLRDYLDETYGPDNYLVKTRSNRWILCLPAPLKAGELDMIEKKVRFHYNSRD